MPTHDEGVVDWRRLASDKNVSLDVARGLWERAQTVGDARQAERAFTQMLDVAATANATHEPGRETLVGTRGVGDAASLGPGKSTLVLQESTLPTAPRPTNPVDALKQDFDDAIDAGKRAIEVLQESSPDDIVAALRALAGNSDVVQRALSVAQRLIANRDAWAARQPPPPKKKRPDEEDDGQPDEPPVDDDAKLR